MPTHGLSHGRLMRESTDCVESALNSDIAEEKLVATRVLESPHTWQRWESEHAGLMRLVAVDGLRRTQAAVLKKAAMRLIQRKALFEYCRTNRLRSETRRRLFAFFHPTLAYEHAVIGEHAVYLRKACSYLCTSHLGLNVVHDAGFLAPMQKYESIYREYFQLYCDAHFSDEPSGQASLLPLLKYQVEECRVAIMSASHGPGRAARELEMRRATGDTVRLRAGSLPLG